MMFQTTTPNKDKETANAILRDFQDVNLRGGHGGDNDDVPSLPSMNDIERNVLNITNNGNKNDNSNCNTVLEKEGGSPTNSSKSGNTMNDDSSEHTHDQLPCIDDVIMNNLNGKFRHGAGSGRFSLHSIQTYLKNRRINRRGSYVMVTLSLIVMMVCILTLSIHLSNTHNIFTKGKTGKATHEDDSSSSSDTYQTSVLTRTGQIIAVLSSGKISDTDAMASLQSPQRQAIDWLADEDAYQIDIPTSLSLESNDNTSADIGQFLQRYAIAVVAIALGNGRDALADTLGFFNDQHECRWHAPYQRPDGSDMRMGITCSTDDDQIEKIVLQTMDLNGHIPKEIGLLTNLRTLRLDSNNITSLLPNSMKHCTNLEQLSLTYNNFHGILDAWLTSSWKNIHELQLSHNGFIHELPAGFGQGFTDLKLLALDNNRFEGPIVNTIEKLTLLEEVYISNNLFQDHLEKSSFQSLSNLRVLDIASNKFSGDLPEALLTSLPSIQVIDVHDNVISGPISDDIISPHDDQQPPIKYLSLKENFLGGPIPSSMSRLGPTLQHLDLSTNRFTGTIPNSFQALTNLKYFYLEDNEQMDPSPIPHWFRFLDDLKELSLMDTSLTGQIPNAFQYMDKLRVLNLGLNHLNGTIPSSLGDATKLQFLLLHRNSLTGNVPQELSNLDQLQLLLLDHNELTGSIHDDICDLTTLSVMVTDCADTTDDCPNCFLGQPQIQCSCCTDCCTSHELGCDAGNYMISTYEGEWGDPYERPGHVFTKDQAKFQPMA